MKPVKLSITAFGAYAANQVVDFRELKQRSFFLIHGPTGAGKTTLLDAMCFALYGETSGDERTGEQMRSHHNKSSLLTEVIFDFSLGDELYRVSRRPKQERPKERGTGTVTVQQKAILWKRTGCESDAQEGMVLASTWKETTESVKTLFGFESKQFRQVIMLPQDQFRQLLKASSSEREEIFKSLFQTDFYEKVEEALKAEAKALADQIEHHRKQRGFVLQQAQATNVSELHEQRQQLEGQLAAMKPEIEARRRAAEHAQAALARAEEHERKIGEREAAEATLNELLQSQSTFESYKQELQEAQKALVLIEAETALKQQLRIADDSELKLRSAQVEYQKAIGAFQQAEAALATETQRGDEREAVRTHLEELRALHGKVKELKDAQQALNVAESEAATALQQRDVAQKKKKALQEKIDKLKEELEKCEVLAAQAVDFRIVEKEAEKAHVQRVQLDGLLKQLSVESQKQGELHSQFLEQENQWHEARAKAANLEHAWLAGQAAVLAQQLSEDTPCPVCGSIHHPQPAKPTDNLPSEAEVEQSREEVQQWEAATEVARRGFAEQTVTVAGLEKQAQLLGQQLGSHIESSSAQLAAKLAGAKKSRAEAEAQEKRADELKRKINEHQSELPQMEADGNDNESKLQEVIGRRAAAQALVGERERGIPDDLRDLDTLVRVGREVGAKLKDLEQVYEQAQARAKDAEQFVVAREAALKELSASASTTRQQADRQLDDLRQRVRENGFADEAAYQQAKRAKTEMDALDRDIRDFEGRMQAAQDRLERAQKAALDLTRPDMRAIRSARDEASAKLEETVKTEVRLSERLNQINVWENQISAIELELQDREKRYAIMGRLSEVANGKNSLNITFQRFVLAALLEDVLIQASKRLQIMSNGRYYLQRARAPFDKRRTGGLDLEVSDTWTGETTRPVETLSGGESFLASLALALGLADVVQAYAGGIRLDTIFVDEGFGSLDSDTLDRAIETLLSLKEGGRLVGIISHVESLTELISTRLEVSASTNGSTARFAIS